MRCQSGPFCSFKDIDPANEKLLAYTRTLDEKRYLVVINFSEQPQKYSLSQGIVIKALALNSDTGYAAKEGATQLDLQPWQASIYQL